MVRFVLLVVLLALVTAVLAAQEEAGTWVSLFDGESPVTGAWLNRRSLRGSNSGVKYLVDEGLLSGYRNEILGVVEVSLAVPVMLLIVFRKRVRWIGPVAGVLVAASVFGAVKASEYLRYSSTGLEMQLLDDARHSNGRDPRKRAGFLCGLYAPVTDAVKPAGEWNTGRIIVHGTKVEHWLNDVRVVAYDLDSEDFKRRLAASRLRNAPGIAGIQGRRIVLQQVPEIVRDDKIAGVPRRANLYCIHPDVPVYSFAQEVRAVWAKWDVLWGCSCSRA